MAFYDNRQFITREELYRDGYSAYKIRKLVDRGELLPINQSYFENPDFEGDSSEFNFVSVLMPRGVICLISAAIYHKLTTSRMLQIDVALPRNSRIPQIPDRLLMQTYYFSKERYQTGIMTINDEENYFHIYDAEKTVCDILFYRNKLGFEVASEVLKNYLRRENRDLNRLMNYAENLHTGKLLREYLEVML